MKDVDQRLYLRQVELREAFERMFATITLIDEERKQEAEQKQKEPRLHMYGTVRQTQTCRIGACSYCGATGVQGLSRNAKWRWFNVHSEELPAECAAR